MDDSQETSHEDSPSFVHTPVMVDEVMRLLAPQPSEVAVDCTVGLGGHAALVSQAVGRTGVVIGMDLDAHALGLAGVRLAGGPARWVPIHGRFDAIPERMQELGLRADMVLADLGIGSHQLAAGDRGFSFAMDGPLDMRFDPSHGPTAADVLARTNERELADLIYKFGEEPLSRKIARKLVEARRREPIRMTAELARLVEEAYGGRARYSRRHPATRTFMALRIAVNDELGVLHTLLDAVMSDAQRIRRHGTGAWLNPGARVAIISFHSLEDRLVKHSFADLVKGELAQRLTRKPLIAGEEECSRNPRARSAKLRAVMVGGPANVA